MLSPQNPLSHLQQFSQKCRILFFASRYCLESSNYLEVSMPAKAIPDGFSFSLPFMQLVKVPIPDSLLWTCLQGNTCKYIFCVLLAGKHGTRAAFSRLFMLVNEGFGGSFVKSYFWPHSRGNAEVLFTRLSQVPPFLGNSNFAVALDCYLFKIANSMFFLGQLNTVHLVSPGQNAL